MYFDYKTKQWTSSENINDIKMNECIQELLLWKGEAPFWADNGLDYEGLFNGNTDITAGVLGIIEKYKKWFADILVDSVEEDEELLFNIGFVTNTLTDDSPISNENSYNITYQRTKSGWSVNAI